MWFCTHLSGFSRSTRLALASVIAGMLLTAGCQDSPTAPEQPEIAAPEQSSVAAPALAVAANSWSTRANMPTDRVNTTTAAVTNAQGHSILYVIGGRSPSSTAGFCSAGLSKVQAYDATTNTWSTRAPFPHPIQYTNGAAVINGKVYMTGGCTGYKAYHGWTWMYDPATNTWTEKASMPVATWAGNTGVIQNKLYVLSSCDGQEDCGTSTDLFFGSYDPATNTWTSLSLPPSRSGHLFGGSAVIGGKFYVAGGDNNGLVEVYDPGTNQWSSGRAMPTPRRRFASAAVAGKLYAIGGLRSSDFAPVAATSVYDPATDSWKNLAPAPRGGSGLAAGRVFVNGKPRIELIGGPRPGNNLQYIP
jgi:N-acetylneuraminic acid mutarotase